ncbi:MAG: NADH-quinone oxidoreductase subunit [Actinomycetota bacterium]|jgi:NADH-quinone oxidoreductase subunit M|nr:NADH-quinone oxidoreductase subunit [Actinomycetota bacterium]
MAFPYAAALLAVPAAGAAVTAAIPASKEKAVRAVSIGFSLVALILSAALLVDFDKGVAGYQFVESKVWIKPLGIHYLMGVDGISLFMVVLTGLLFPIAMLASTHVGKRVNAYFALMLVLEAALMGIFLSVDLFLFFVFWEAMLVPMYFLIGVWGYDRRVYAALKFFIYTAAGSALLLLGILSLAVLHAKAPGAHLTFDLRTLMAWKGLDPNTARWLFLAFGASFAIKVPLFPLHTWLPDAHVEAPTAGSVLLAGLLLKLGAYGFLRFSLTLFPQASVDFAPLMLTLATIGILYGAIVATMQRDLKKVVAYSSVAHLGFVVLGTFALTTVGIEGGLFTMVSHGLTTGALFLLVGILYDRRHTRQIDAFGGVWKAAPKLGGIFLAVTFASIGLPGLSGFVGEFLSLIGTFVVHRPYAVFAAAGVILAAVYMLWSFQRVFTGEPTGENATFADMNRLEMATVLPLLGFSLFLGLYPKPLLERVEPSVKALIAHVESRSDYQQPKVVELGPKAVASSKAGAK